MCNDLPLEEMTTKKTAKKKTEKEVEIEPLKKRKGYTKNEKDIRTISKSEDKRALWVMLDRYVDETPDQPRHPENIDDIKQIIQAQKDYPEIVDLENMTGWCKIWDAIIDHWPRLTELSEAGSSREVRDLLREIAAPYCTNQITGDFSSSIYE
jgi:hypothetical protein